jgi:glycerate kinase
MRILIAPNAFKHSLTAADAALAIEEGLQQSALPCETECFPIGDGGDGTAELIVEKRGGEVVPTAVRDALGRPIRTHYGLIDAGSTAIIEMADASGLRLLKHEELNPLIALSYGTGEQIRLALDRGARSIIIGMGGSATVDGGTGILQALGVRFLDAEGNELKDMPGSLTRLASLDLSELDPRIGGCEVVVLCDVDNFLLGSSGAAAMFGPQKGASPEGVQQLDAALGRFSEVAFSHTGRDMSSVKYGGTAGGASAGLYALLNARLVNGIDHFLQLTGFDAALEHASLVITGEGSIDEQTLQGKGPFGVAARAREKGVPVIGLAGRLPLERNTALHEYFNVLLSIGHQPQDLSSALRDTRRNMVRVASEIGNLLALPRSFAL